MYLLDVIMKTACNKVGKIIKIVDPLRILRRWKKKKNIIKLALNSTITKTNTTNVTHLEVLN